MIIIESSLFLLTDTISIEEGKDLFTKSINEDSRFSKEIILERLNVLDCYKNYYSFEINVLDLPYYLKGLRDEYSYDGKIYFSLVYTDPDLILNEINKKLSKPIDKETFEIKNSKKDIIYKRLLENIELKAKCSALDANNRFLYNTKVEIGLLDNLKNTRTNIYYEHLLAFYYKSEERKNDFISVLSLNNKSFYSLEYA